MQSCARAGWGQKLVIYDPPYITRQSTRDARESSSSAGPCRHTHEIRQLDHANFTTTKFDCASSCSRFPFMFRKIALTRRRQRYGWVWECHHSRTCWNNFIVSFGSLAIFSLWNERSQAARDSSEIIIGDIKHFPGWHIKKNCVHKLLLSRVRERSSRRRRRHATDLCARHSLHLLFIQPYKWISLILH